MLYVPILRLIFRNFICYEGFLFSCHVKSVNLSSFICLFFLVAFLLFSHPFSVFFYSFFLISHFPFLFPSFFYIPGTSSKKYSISIHESKCGIVDCHLHTKTKFIQICTSFPFCFVQKEEKEEKNEKMKMN